MRAEVRLCYDGRGVAADEAGQGRISLGDLASLVREGRIETVLVVFPDLYGRLLGKRFEDFL